MVAFLIDAFDFVRQPGREAQGAVALEDMERLVEDLPIQNSDARWHAKSERGPLGEPLIRLTIDAEVVLECQRCLADFALPLHTEAVLHIVKTEAQLNADDIVHEGDDDGEGDEDDVGASALPERVLGSPRFDLLEQVEDELILCVPYVPRHDVCPEPLVVPASVSEDVSAKKADNDGQQDPSSTDEAVDGAEGKRPSPFAVLAQLKTRKP
ncbi:DUF177 domain-containing protein [Pigmentiphaga aceris]|uniref:Large ribosomal RNA subunit accumulation protein YceD n=1 Tax=Pigmentiphaga aceris TaxID=1940612 RepID=A0A5C0AXR9_9BURK|nr:YceD family protein [Pigmentiphaga aceris]QEI06955.1 DUF177 domain-containing protein [Pigmentiphaga aceris]